MADFCRHTCWGVAGLDLRSGFDCARVPAGDAPEQPGPSGTQLTGPVVVAAAVAVLSLVALVESAARAVFTAAAAVGVVALLTRLLAASARPGLSFLPIRQVEQRRLLLSGPVAVLEYAAPSAGLSRARHTGKLLLRQSVL